MVSKMIGNSRRRFVLLLTLLCASLLLTTARADIDAQQFDNAEQEQRYRALIAELRCPKCQNQNIADSNAPLAKDLRDIAHQKIVAGESDAAIRQFMQERYGDFILYRPPVKESTFLLWFGPALVLLAALIGLLFWWRRQRGSAASGTRPLSEDEQRQLQALLQRTDDKN